MPAKGTIYPTDIGCYTLGKAPPLEVADLLLCMGSNAGTACGLAVATDQKIITFMGDSTFFHSGIPPIINALYHDCVISILDNVPSKFKDINKKAFQDGMKAIQKM